MRSPWANTSTPPGQEQAPAPRVVFEARRRTEEEREPLRAICGVCEYNARGTCMASKCCGGRNPVEVLFNLSTTRCPKGKW